MKFFGLLTIVFACFVSSSLNGEIFSPYHGKTTLGWLATDKQFSSFYKFIKHNSEALEKFVEEELTVFIPTNEALANMQGSMYSDFALYHMTSTSKDISEIRRSTYLISVNPNLPKLWISSSNDNEIYVNNAKVVSTAYFSTSRSIKNKLLTQSVILIDQPLDAVIRAPPKPFAAFDLLTSPGKFGLHKYLSVSFLKFKLYEKNLTSLFSSDGGHTYFIPIDKEISPQKYQSLNDYAIKGHIVPNVTLFTRPTIRDFNYETMANDNSVYMVLGFIEIGEKLYVRSRTVFGTDENPEGEYIIEIIASDIPVANGVVHLISEPLGIPKRHLKPFPYKSVLEMLSTHDELRIFYEMGQNTGFNSMLKTQNKSFTLFVPNDFSWRQIQKQNLEYFDSRLQLLKRHLIISESPLSIERLYAMSSDIEYDQKKLVELETAGGRMKVFIHKKDTASGEVYYIQWYNKLIKVVRANYECSDGFIHVIASPFVSLQKTYYNYYGEDAEDQ